MNKQMQDVVDTLLQEAEFAQKHLHATDSKIVEAARFAADLIENLLTTNTEFIESVKEAAEVLEDAGYHAKNLRTAIRRACHERTEA